jgi:ubiquinone/menaquinone biosynthesis C-methylase UbiE
VTGAIEWIEAELDIRESNSANSLFQGMESQSWYCLPVIYQPFDGAQRLHFVDRGQILDFAFSSGGGRLLDFGPGDGWPSLSIAPMVDEVVGVDGSQRRVETCRSNARRLGIDNIRFVHVAPGQPLPFADSSFDGATAASSIEQAPAPRETLAELHRILNSRGRLRIHYESLGYYRGRAERECRLIDFVGGQTLLLAFDRHVDEEYVRHYGLLLDLTRSEVESVLSGSGAKVSFGALTPEALSSLREHLADATTWTTKHPSCGTWLRWLKEARFSSALPTYDGGWFAGRLFDQQSEPKRLRDMEAVDELLRPLVKVVTGMEAPSTSKPGVWDHWITAIK